MLAKLDMVAVLAAKEIFDYIMQPFPTGLGLVLFVYIFYRFSFIITQFYILYLSIGKAVSKKEREELNLKDSTLVYGEITFDMLGTVLEKIKKVYGKSNVGASGASGIALT